MLNPKKIEHIIQQIQDNLPKGIKDLGQDAEAKVKQVLQAQLSKLDIVTREEFDVQTQVLMRTREKLTALEKRVEELLGEKDTIKNSVSTKKKNAVFFDRTLVSIPPKMRNKYVNFPILTRKT